MNQLRLEFDDPAVARRVLDRVVPAAAAQADFAIDRVVNAQAAVDAVVAAMDAVIGSARQWQFVLAGGDGQIRLVVENLDHAELERLEQRMNLPDVGNVAARLGTITFNGDQGSPQLLLELE